MIERSFKEAAQILDTTEGTVRRWCQHLEKEGYLINKTDTNRRKLSEKDIEVMAEIKRLVEPLGLIDACAYVAFKHSSNVEREDSSAEKEKVDTSLTQRFQGLDEIINQIDMLLYWKGPVAALQLKEKWDGFATSFKNHFQVE